jgi:hypothetical protein
MSSRIDRELLKRVLRENIETLCRHFFPNGKKVGEEWQVGSLAGEEGRTLNIHLGTDRAGIFQDFNTGEHGDFVQAIKAARGLGFVEAALEIGRVVGVSLEQCGNSNSASGSSRASGARYTTSASTKPPDWEKDYSLTETDLKELAAWRGLSDSFCSWLVDRRLIGRQNGSWAFPVHCDGALVSAQVRHEKNKWGYKPRLKDIGVSVSPLVIGDLTSAEKVFSSESQWDIFSLLDKLGIQHGEPIAGIATRGAQNGSLIGTLEIKAELYLVPQNDDAGRAWLEHAAGAASCTMRVLSVPGAYHDVDEWLHAIKDIAEFIEAIRNAPQRQNPGQRVYIEFHPPSYYLAYEPPHDLVLVGDRHIVRGAVFIIGGPPGVGKSRCSIALAIAGAQQVPWFGLETLVQFRTLILQTENGRLRLKEELAEIDEPVLEDHLLVCPPPPYGLCFDKREFRDQLRAYKNNFKPHVILIDPWNSITEDDRLKDYREALDSVIAVFDVGTDSGPAIGILAHTRKALASERASGRALLATLSGSYLIGGRPRCVFVMQSASDDVNETKIVWTCCKNNDGKLGPRSVWERRNGLFVEVQNFDWNTFDHPQQEYGPKLVVEYLTRLGQSASKNQIRAELEMQGISKSSAYRLIEKAVLQKLIKFNHKTKVFSLI